MGRELALDTRLPTDGKSGTPYRDMTEVARHFLGNMSEVASGSVTGTGSALEVETPFDPGAVILFNRTAPCLVIKMPGMTGANAMKLAGTPALTYDADSCTLGVADGKGFTIGADADINTAAEVIEWMAFGFRDRSGESV